MGSATTYDNRMGEEITIKASRDIDDRISEIHTTNNEIIKLDKMQIYNLRSYDLARVGRLYKQESGKIFYYQRNSYCGNSFFLISSLNA